MRRVFFILILLLFILFLSGCIRSRVVVTSEPVGAGVTMNGEYRGRTPVTIPFGWYWFYDMKVEKDGYVPLESRERFKAPVWAWIPFDLFVEAMPFNVYDTKERHYTLVSDEES